MDRKTYYPNNQRKKTGVVTLILDKIGFKRDYY